MVQLTDLIGWVATAVFVGSYAFKQPDRLRKVQMAGAALWIGYGLLMQAPPIVVTNVLVVAAAAWASRRQPGAEA
jgi:hypothetical protein